MADAPKCPKCLKRNIISQTYRNAITGFFKCHECGDIYTKQDFNEIDYKWKTDAHDWAKDKGFDPKIHIIDGAISKGKKNAKRPKIISE